jgi:hypothetical protein
MSALPPIADIDSVPPTTPRLHPNLAEIYRKKVGNIQDALSDPETQSEASEILRGLIERVAISTAEDGSTIELVGEILQWTRSPETWTLSRFGKGGCGGSQPS